MTGKHELCLIALERYRHEHFRDPQGDQGRRQFHFRIEPRKLIAFRTRPYLSDQPCIGLALAQPLLVSLAERELTVQSREGVELRVHRSVRRTLKSKEPVPSLLARYVRVTHRGQLSKSSSSASTSTIKRFPGYQGWVVVSRERPVLIARREKKVAHSFWILPVG